MNFVGNLVRPGFDANALWVPLYDDPLTPPLVALMTVFLLWSLLRPRCPAWRYILTQTLLIFLAVDAAAAAAKSHLAEDISDGFPPVLAWLVAAALISQVLRVWRDGSPDRRAPVCPPEVRVLATVAGMVMVAALFLLAQFFVWGTAQRRANADCIVVMGAGIMLDGGPSTALYERTRTACRLWRAGCAPYLIFSGGPWEPRAMRYVAEEMGIPRECQVLDPEGLSTFHTALSARRIMRERGWRTAVVVSHEYHLSRTWLAFRRAGVTAETAAAERTRIIPKDAYHIPREMAAWVYYYFRPLWAQGWREQGGEAAPRG